MTTAPPTTFPGVELTFEGYVGCSNMYTTAQTEKAIDNNPTTYWSTSNGQGINSWFQITFQYRAIVNRIKITARVGGQLQAPTEFYVYGSNTGYFAGEEVELYHVSGLSWATGETKIFDFSNDDYYQYYRILNVALGSGTVCSYAEIEYWNTDGIPAQHLYPSYSADLATGETATADSYLSATYLPSKAIDDNTSTRWCAGNYPPRWWKLEFANATRINRWVINSGPAGSEPQHPITFTIAASDTGVFGGEEVVLFYVDNINSWPALTIRYFEFANNTAYKYYRIYISAVRTGAFTSLSEVQLHTGEWVTTAGPTTVAPTTLAPTTLAPTTLAPTTLAPTTLAPTTEAPTTLAPTTLAPTTVAPTTLAPTTLAPTTLAPTTVAPTTLAPTTIAPTTKAPTTLAPTTLAPTTLAPTTLAPTTLAPTTLAPTTLAPTTLAPTTLAPTTIAPTTLAPTTLAPTTVAPTTVTPTTVAPTTVAPTTVAPTTVAPPTTVVPTTVAPTTVAPTTVAVSTLGPTTLAPTTLLSTVPPTTAMPPICVHVVYSLIADGGTLESDVEDEPEGYSKPITEETLTSGILDEKTLQSLITSEGTLKSLIC